MRRLLFIFVWLSIGVISHASNHSFEVGEGAFLLDGKPFVVKAAEVHYPRIPRSYWEHRIQMCKALGMNTMCIYVFWNYHEQQMDQFCFEGQTDVAEFCRLCQKNGMYVIVRPGPYACAEWEMGGLPWWLLKKKDIRLREQDEFFMQRAKIFEEKLAEQLRPFAIYNGGPIIMVQVENEYGSYGEDKPYMSAMRDIIRNSWGKEMALFQCDWSSNFWKNGLDDLTWTMNFGTGANIDEQFKRLGEMRPTAPKMCSEFWSGWFDKWGARHETRPAKDMVKGIDEMLSKGISFSLYMTHGGTSFGHWAGANSPGFAPDVTSYDYDAPINEYGLTTPKYYELRSTMTKYNAGKKLPAVPKAPMPIISVPQFSLTEYAPLENGVTNSVKGPLKTFEEMDMGWGIMVYSTHLPEISTRSVLKADIHDFAQVYVDGKYVGKIDRVNNEKSIMLPVVKKGSELKIVVEAMGRINFGRAIKDFKGIVGDVTITTETDEHETVLKPTVWTNSTIPDDYTVAKKAFLANKSKESVASNAPGYYRGCFKLSKVGDTFLNFETWGKGQVYVNGHAMGRIWYIGPQQTLYIPGCWLKKGLNEVVVIDVLGPKKAVSWGQNTPELNKLQLDKANKHNNIADKPDLSLSTPVASGSFAAGNGWQTIKFNKPQSGRYVALECLSTHDGKQAAIAEIHLQDVNGKRISRESWSAKFADSENENGNHTLDKVFDLQESTYWQAEKGSEPRCLLVIDLGSEQTIGALEYLPRAEQGAPGSVKDYRVFISTSFLPLSVSSLNLEEGFLNPPQEARPRVWWHWMNGNVTKDGIRKDIEWMNRVGIAGFHYFDAGMSTPQIVENRLTYMSSEWKDAFKYAVTMADSLNMEVATASCPGWSNTGGPWVKPEQAMKKMTWREMRIKGGKKVKVNLPSPFTTTGFFQNYSKSNSKSTKAEWYKDTYVIAVRLPEADKTLQQLNAKVSSSSGELDIDALTDDDLMTNVQLTGDDNLGYAWIQYTFKKPQTIKALSVVDGRVRTEWQALPALVTKWIEYSIDGNEWVKLSDIPHGGTLRQTIEVPPTTAKYFRVCFNKSGKSSSHSIAELNLYPISRVNHSEEKSGYATPSDLNNHPTSADAEEAVACKDIYDLTNLVDPNGTLSWDAPKGDWKIYRFGYSLTGKENHPASPEATGLEVSKIDKEAFKQFLEYYLDTYKQTLSSNLIGQRGLHYLLIDSYEAGWETWMPTLPQEFERRRGYSLVKWLPVLTGQIVESADKSESFLFDWRTTIGELIAENMYENAANIAKSRGMESYFEAHENGRLYLADGMSVKSKADIPMAAMWAVLPGQKTQNSTPEMAESDLRESASVAHLYGKKFVAAESMTANGLDGGAYSYYPGKLKTTADLEMANGVNRFVIHESSHQPVDDKKPGLGLGIFGQWFNRHETWAEQAKSWTDYLARSSYMLQQGRNVADVLYYYGEDDVVTSLFAFQHPEIPFSYNYDYLNKEALLELISFDGKYFTTPTGSKFSLLVIDKNCQHFSPAVKKKLESLKLQGAVICDARTESMVEALKNITPDFTTRDMSNLRYVHRSTANSDIYWVNNRSNEARSIDAVFRVSGLKPTLWHPETGIIENVPYEIKDNETVVHFNMVANDAVFVVFSGKPEATKAVVPEKSVSLFCGIDSPWTVQFDETMGAPKEVTFNKLISYTEAADEGIKYYSGTAAYKNSIQISASDLKRGHFVLDLGKVGCMAKVIVNGHDLGVLWKAPYTVDVTDALKPGKNELEFQVVNQWVNRIIGDQQPDCKQKYTYTPHNFYNANSDLLPAGLLGPVRLMLVCN